MEAYDAGCAAVESVERATRDSGQSSGQDASAGQRLVGLDDSEKRAVERLPNRIRRPSEIVVFDRRRDSAELKLDNAKKILRRFLMFHHSMGMNGP